MATIQLESVSDPFAEGDPGLVGAAMEVLLRLEAMGLLTSDVDRLDRAAIREIAAVASRSGIAKADAVQLLGAGRMSAEVVRGFLEAVTDALDASPMPETELPLLLHLFDHERLARLLESSESSLRRYVAGARRPPDDLAARAHFLSLVVAYLHGAYNDIGVRRWFDRPRALLDGKTPAQMLRKGWTPESASAGKVIDLARSLLASPAT